MAQILEKTQNSSLGRFDGYDETTRYQMVPWDETRTGFDVVSADDEMEISIEPPNIAEFRNRQITSGHDRNVDASKFFLAPQSAVKFDIFGKWPGNAVVVVRDPRGINVSHIIISVKAKMHKFYSLVMVHDTKHRCPWLEPTIRPMMDRIKELYQGQANVILSERTAEIYQTEIKDRDLGKPIVLDIVSPFDKPLQYWEVIRQRTATAAWNGNIMVLCFTWAVNWKKTIKHDNLLGLTKGNFCFVEYNSTDHTQNVLVTAHEIGHALGLGHSSNSRLMNASFSRNATLNQFEIDTLNQSDHMKLHRNTTIDF